MFDWILDTIHNFIRYGFSWASFAGALVLFLKNRSLRRRINKLLPRPLRDQEQEKLDYIIHLLEGGAPCANSRALKYSAANAGTQSISRSGERSVVLFAGKSTISFMRRMKELAKFLRKMGSRKFWALVSAVVVSCMVLFGYSDDVITKVVALITNVGAVVVYLLVEGSIDRATQQQQVYVVPGSAGPTEGGSIDAESAIPDQPRK